jgi:hypothetical protein
LKNHLYIYNFKKELMPFLKYNICSEILYLLKNNKPY